MSATSGNYTVEQFAPVSPRNAKNGTNGSGSSGGPPPYVPEPWPVLDGIALYGLAGEATTCLMPETESDPAALLLSYLASFGNAIGRGPHYVVEDSRHFTNLFVLLAGDTAKARKGTSAERIRAIFELADPPWTQERLQGGISSGEGIIWAVRDAIFNLRKGVMEMIDPGIADKRLLLYEPEFSSVLTMLNRQGNILSCVMRDAWDCRPLLQTMTKHSPARATEAYISIISHITIQELQRRLDETSMANGFANRFLFGCVKRLRLLPHGGNLPEDTRQRLGKRTLDALTTARTLARVQMDDAARERWTVEYPILTASGDKLIDYMTARAEAQVVRLALLYALLDCAPAIGVAHLEPALALWRYCKASARYIFGEMTGDVAGDVILRALRQAGTNGLAKTDIINLFGRNLMAAKIDLALNRLQTTGKAVCRMSPLGPGGAGRPRQIWYAV